MELRQGSTLQGGKYRIIRVIGQGGFGITYLAEHSWLKKNVAIKEFFPKTFCGRNDTTSQVRIATEANVTIVNRLRQKFLKEAEHIAKMDCPYIVRIIDVFEENDTAYYVMDYIEGRSLADIVKSSGPLPVSKAIGYITKIGQALEYIHTKRINHLDVKPANIMVWKKDDSPVLIDFGLSKQYDTAGKQTSTTPVGISHGYAPIEQYSDGGVKEFSPRTDVYALGATLYYLLSGKTPDQAPNLISQGLTFPPSIPESLRGPIRKAMSAGRQDRYPTVSSFIKALGNDKSPREDTAAVITPRVEPPSHISEGHSSLVDKYIVEEKPFYKQVWFKVLSIIIAVSGLLWLLVDMYNSDYTEYDSSMESTEVAEVADILCENHIGDFRYTGEVDGNSIPHGRGKAVFTSVYVADSIGNIESLPTGSFDGPTYDGEWIHGVMQGQATYHTGDGDVFTGIFRNNEYSSGRYTTSDGEYFEGSFKDEQPYNGSWYSKKGNVISVVKNGKES